MLTVGRTGPSPFRVLDQQDLQAKRNTLPFNTVAASAQPFPELSQGGKSQAWVGWQEPCRQGSPLPRSREDRCITATAPPPPRARSEGGGQEEQSRAQIHGLT